jgi:uncharacterized protein YuzE
MANILRRSRVRIEFDPVRDLLYLYFAEPEAKAVETKTISPGVHADFDRDGRLIGIEIIDASELMGRKIEFGLPETALPGKS